MATQIKQDPPENPLIPEKYLDVPSQRLYYLSLGLLCQAIKIFDFLRSFAWIDSRNALCRKWLLVDILYCVILTQLRIPRLRYSRATVLLQVLILWFIDGVLFGGISVNLSTLFGASSLTGHQDLQSTSKSLGIMNILAAITFGLASANSRDVHLQGQHTIRMSPISTAHLNPQNLNFCLSPSSSVIIPVVLNNTDISGLRYSLRPLGFPERDSKIEFHDLSVKDFKAIQETYREKLQLAVQTTKQTKDDEYDEYDDDDDERQTQEAHHSLQRTQSLVHILVNRPGIVRLERVYDSSNLDARLVTSQAVVAPCPRVQFTKDDESTQDAIRCIGQKADPQLKISVYGVPPLSLKWIRSVNGNREQFLVEGIETEHKDHDSEVRHDESQLVESSPVVMTSAVPHPDEVIVPLTVSLDQPGTYLYALEEVTDGAGNTVLVETDPISFESISASAMTTTRSFIVLQKPSVSFAYCSSDMPASLLIGSETKLNLDPTSLDNFDKPWDMQIQYQPPVDRPSGKQLKTWKKTLNYDGESRDLSFNVNAPGEYKIVGFKGKYCAGTILAPDLCRVIEKPKPSAEIEWKRIHECSGDTGVSAALILHGTPPFHVYYRMQRDKEQPLEISKTFTSSRADLTLQPEQSGHYIFSFVAISDANYRKIELQGPSIDQMIHPVASAEFSDSHGTGRGKRIVSTCSGDSVDIDVDLRGTGPWNLELQIIGPRRAEILQIQRIETPKKTIKIPIPPELQSSGGSFEIALVSVEDVSKCKRPISVPGIEVKVKRVVPTAQFYGSKEDRVIKVTEHQKTKLPLRLTGDGPWRIKYKTQDSPKVYTATHYNRNSELEVTEKGTFEIIAVFDSQCPGTILPEASTYIVDWILRPSATLSPSTGATYEPHNGSYILPSICEGSNGHVDLDLIGRPPFQIMYNIAQDNENGGTKIMGQPTFNSIQPRTRFQLHTSRPGRMYYEVKQIGDASYPLTKHKDTVIPRSERLLFEQQVSIRPSAYFKSRGRLQYCLTDPLVALDSASQDGLVGFEGSPPFSLVLSIKNIATSQLDRRTIQVPMNDWRLNLPSYIFTTIGPHLISIETVADSSGCEPTASDPHLRSIWVDVAETAAIIPIERRDHICVGDIAQFQLEGIPPWTVTYKVNGKTHFQEAKTSPFTLHMQQAGQFTITSVSHQQKMCQAAVTDLRYNVHELPSAQVGHGKKILQDIHEGDQAEIVFTLIGEPPFTFTYQRTELPTKKGIASKVLETHTVSRIQGHEYSIFTALEGTWTITSISDRYCRYPPVQPDVTLDKLN